MDNKVSKYANGFTFLLSKDSGEAVLTFTQNQPQYDEQTGKFEGKAGREVATIILPYKMVRGLCSSLEDALKKEEEKMKRS